MVYYEFCVLEIPTLKDMKFARISLFRPSLKNTSILEAIRPKFSIPEYQASPPKNAIIVKTNRRAMLEEIF